MIPKDIWDFFIVVRDRETGEPIGSAPMKTGQPHVKVNLFSLNFVMSFVDGPQERVQFAGRVAGMLSHMFGGMVYGRPELPLFGEWTLLADHTPEALGRELDELLALVDETGEALRERYEN